MTSASQKRRPSARKKETAFKKPEANPAPEPPLWGVKLQADWPQSPVATQSELERVASEIALLQSQERRIIANLDYHQDIVEACQRDLAEARLKHAELLREMDRLAVPVTK
jgi:hypothetical protein